MASNISPHHIGNRSATFKKPQQGEKKMNIHPKDLSIVWGEDDRYWNVPQEGDKPAELYQVSWLEVTGSVDKTSPEKEYEVGFHVSLTPDAFGWGNSPIYIMVKRGKAGKFAWKKMNLNTQTQSKEEFDITGSVLKADDANNDEQIYFGLYEVWSGKWKGGLKIHHAFIKEMP